MSLEKRVRILPTEFLSKKRVEVLSSDVTIEKWSFLDASRTPEVISTFLNKAEIINATVTTSRTTA